MRASLSLVLYSFILLPSYHVHAQLLDGVGIQAGYVNAGVFGDVPGAAQGRGGVSVAVVAELRLNSSVSILPSLEYLQRGFAQEFTSHSSDGSGAVTTHAASRLHYLSVPLLLEGKYAMERLQLAPYVRLGPRIDVLLGREAGSFQINNEEIRSQIVDRYRTVIYGITGGVGIEFGFLPLPVSVELRRNVDITASVPDRGDAGDIVAGLKNRTWQALIEIRW